MKQFKVNDIVYGILHFSDLEKCILTNIEFVYGKILSIKPHEFDKRVTVYEIQDNNDNTIETIYDSEENPLIFETKEEMYKAIFNHEKNFINQKLDELLKCEKEFIENKNKFFEKYMSHPFNVDIEDMK